MASLVSRAPLLAAALIAASAGVAGAATSVTQASERTWRAASWADALRKLPCDAFRRADDGGWVMPGKIEISEHTVISNMTVSDPGEAAALNRRCGASSSPPQSGP
jgi:hypothetical protein